MRLFLAFSSFVVCLGFVNTCGVNEFKSPKSGKCCPLCPAGKHFLKDCGQDYSTVCQACPKNQFTAKPNNFSACENCTNVKCDSASGKILKQCTPTSNSRCECPKDKYWHIGTLRCKDCKECGPGEQETSSCKTYEDKKCEKCPEGTYSANNICVTCSHCRKGEVVAEECSIWKDTLCDKPSIHHTTPYSQNVNMPTLLPSNSTPEPRTTDPESRIEKDDTSKVPHSCEPRIFSDGVTWFLIGLVFLLFCIILFLAQPKVKKYVSKRKTPTPPQTAGKVPIIVKPKSSEVAPIQENNVKFSSLPASVTEDLASYLNAKQGKNWKHLAGLMDYSTPFTQNLELEPREATQRLLQEWMQKTGSTVFRLYCLLQKLGRDDAINVLLPFLTTPKTRGEVDV